MTQSPFSTTETIAVVFIAGFAIQQALQILDPLVNYALSRIKEWKSTIFSTGGMADGDFKKAVMAALAFSLGTAAVHLTGIKLLALVNPDYKGTGDILISGLVLGTGTEAVNTVLKYAGYLKEAQKPAQAVEVTIIPDTVKLKQGTSYAFHANVKNGENQVDWSVLHGAGGSIDAKGKYTAPAEAGAYQVMAVSKVDPSRYSIATVTVTG